MHVPVCSHQHPVSTIMKLSRNPLTSLPLRCWAVSGLLLGFVAAAAANDGAAVASDQQQQQRPLPGLSAYEAPAGFPTSAFSSYWVKPVATAEPQPALYDPVLNKTFPLNLTNPLTIPVNNSDPLYYPTPIANISKVEAQAVVNNALRQIDEIITGSYITGNCSKCIASLAVAQGAAQIAPSLIPDALVSVCKKYRLHSNSTCERDFESFTFGTSWTQVLALADVTGLDGQYICNYLSTSFCAAPTVSPLNTTGLFPKAKPANAKAPKASGKRVKVLHLSDIHVDPRYSAGAEANCTSNLCCRANNFNTALPTGQISLASPLYGSFLCDSPYDLVLSALEAIGPLTGTNATNPPAWAIYTGDLTAHDPQEQLSRAYVEYAEDSINYMLKQYIKAPIFPVLGNHDTNPVAIDAPHSFPGPLAEQLSWNYDHVVGLWQNNGWLDAEQAAQAKLHYGGYSVKNHYGLRIITLNGDFWYHSNILNLVNTSNPDSSGSFAFLIDELQKAEDAGERAWIMAHVLSGWDGSNALPNPTNLLYQIVERYSPHVIAAIFFGHTHEDQFEIFYANNGTVQNSSTALNIAWIGPAVTPLTNLNSGFRMYEVDTGSFEVFESHTWYANVSAFPAAQAANQGPTFRYEYSARDTYGEHLLLSTNATSKTNSTISPWPSDAPLNATFWHLVTEAMQRNRTLIELHNSYQGKLSVKSPNCTSDACAAAKICYMRSGNAALGRSCPQGYGSVQSPFDPK